MICDAAVGCCNKDDQEFCGLASKQALLSAGRGSTPFIALIALIAVLFALAGLVVYYRRKYMKERDPDMPTVTFHPHEKGYTAPGDDPNEFDNPLYRTSMVVDQPQRVAVPAKLARSTSEKMKLEEDKEDWEKAEYTSFDVYGHGHGPSSSTVLDGHRPSSSTTSPRYEVPYRVTMNSPENRQRENVANEEKSRVGKHS